MNRLPKVRQKNITFGVFYYVLIYEDKVQIYRLKKQGISLKKFSKKYGINLSNLRYLVRFIERYGIESVKKGKNCYYPPELKQEIINRVLLEGRSHRSVSLDYAFPSSGIFSNWLVQYKKNGYPIVEETRGRLSKMGRKPKKKPEEMTGFERLQKELVYLRAENALLKKVRELRLKEEKEKEERQKLFKNERLNSP